RMAVVTSRKRGRFLRTTRSMRSGSSGMGRPASPTVMVSKCPMLATTAAILALRMPLFFIWSGLPSFDRLIVIVPVERLGLIRVGRHTGAQRIKHQLVTVVDLQLFLQVLNVRANGTLAQEQLFSDLMVGGALADETEHFALAFGQRLGQYVTIGNAPCDL